jgi:aralkylamine N-acetyltransferase
VDARDDVRVVLDRDLPVEGVVELYRAGGWWMDGDDPSLIPPLLARSLFVAAAWQGDRLVGMARALGDGVSDAYIQDVVVLPELRGGGVGGRLVTLLRDACSDAGILWVGLVAQPGTTAFYRRLGFREMEGHVAMRYRPRVPEE